MERGESVVRLYDIGRLRAEEDDQEEEDEDRNDDDDDSDNSDDGDMDQDDDCKFLTLDLHYDFLPSLIITQCGS